MGQGANTQPRPPLKTADEQDALTGWRRVYAYLRRAGATAQAKRRYRRRERAALKAADRAYSVAGDDFRSEIES